MFGALLEVAMLKKCTPLWREAHFEGKTYKTPGSDQLLVMSKKCMPWWREAHVEVKMYKAHQVWSTFGSCDVEKVHAVVARSTFRSQNVQSTPGSDHSWKFRCRKSARYCGTKQISKSKCTKHCFLGPLLQVEMSKKCTPLWREAHFEVNMFKTPGSDHFWRLRCRFAWQRKGLCTLSKVSTTKGFCSIFKYNHHYTTLHSNTLHCNYNYTFTTVHYTTLHYTPLPPLHYTQLHSFTPNCTQLHTITLHYTTPRHTTPHSTTLHCTALHCTKLHYTTLHYCTPRYTTLQYNTVQYTTLH